jgi:PAS domain S-box-containing protein
VDHAHRRGILHRDLKPSNILLDAEGEPFVSDFGLAKPLGEIANQGSDARQGTLSLADALTQTGLVLGTPRYMAPEQAAAQSDLTTAADIYALGVILYVLLTGRWPFDTTDVNQFLEQLRQAEPEPPRAVNPLVDADLQRICLTCLEKDPRKRYSSAAELADALDPPIGKGYQADDLAQALFHEAGDALFLFEPETDQLLDVNPTAERLTGLPRARLLVQPATYWFRSANQGGNNRLRQAATRTSLFHSQEGFFLRTGQDGVWVPVNVTIARLHLSNQTLALAQARDVREQYEANQRLRRVEAELRRVLASVSDCLWSADWTADNRWSYRYLSPVVENLTGQPAEHFQSDLARWQEIVHPDDRPAWLQGLRKLKSGQNSQTEYRILRPDGSVRWLRELVHVSRGPDAQALQLDGVLTDLTPIKALEAELEQARLTIAQFRGQPETEQEQQPWWLAGGQGGAGQEQGPGS